MANWDDYKTAREEEALALVLAADAINTAEETGDDQQMRSALQLNLQLWLAFKALSLSSHCAFPENTRGSIIKLADFVSAKCARALEGKPSENLRTIAGINLQIAEGLLDALNHTEQQVRDGLAH